MHKCTNARLIEGSLSLGHLPASRYRVGESSRALLEATLRMGEREAFSADVLSRFEVLWKDEGIQAVFSQRNRVQLIDTAGYLFENMRRFVRDDFVPTFDDLIRCRKRTTGVNKITIG